MGASVFLGYQSALEYLCRERYFEASPLGSLGFHLGDCPVAPPARTSRVRSLGGSCPSDDDIRSLLDGPLRGLSTPVHVLVSNPVARSRSRLKVPHAWCIPPIGGSFVKLADGLYASSPELCLVQLARLLTPVELARLAFELCGTYALSPCPDDGFRACSPATATEHVLAFAHRARAAGVRGASALIAALSHVVDGAASPMETVVTLLLCLPYRDGGYHLPLPVLNQQPRATGGGQSVANGTTHRCDLLWPDAGVTLEYEGEAWHVGTRQATKDAVRNNVMASKRHLVFSVTKEQLYDVAQFDFVARQIAHALRKRLYVDDCPYNWFLRRSDLRSTPLPSSGNPLCDERIARSGAWVRRDSHAKHAR